MTERLQKIISSRGAASRRAAEKMIIDGRVTVNGARVQDSAEGEAVGVSGLGPVLPTEVQPA